MGYPFLRGRRILLGITGGIAAYKMVELVRLMRQAGGQVDVLMTHSAEQFVTPLTFETLTRRPVRRDVFEQWTEAEAGHVTLAENADILVIAPATANTIAKVALGLADDMLTVSALACPGPMLVAPAMDHHMYLNQATQGNLQTLRERGIEIIGPDQGELASGLIGHGRLVEPHLLLGAIREILGRGGPLQGRHIVVSSGATREPIDPIRFVTNRSSGRMGHAIAQAAIDAGAGTTLISAPTDLDPPFGAKVVRAESAADMCVAVQQAVKDADALIMAAAVGDYAPAEVSDEKIKKTDEDLTLRLERTVDILASTSREGLIKVGFAAETSNLLEYAAGKLSSKGVDLLVANDARRAMGAEENQAYFLRPGATPQELPLMSKDELATRIVHELVSLVGATDTEVEDKDATAS
jgi:phosphopantothenoylcysteine decarboxylase / phosphopantothenate---cysteine ligase